QAEDGIRGFHVTGVQTCALPILAPTAGATRRAKADCQSRRFTPPQWLDPRFLDHGLATAATEHDLTGISHAPRDNEYFLLRTFRSEERRVGRERQDAVAVAIEDT